MLALTAILAAAAAPVVSPMPETIALTLYRAPGRGTRERMDLGSLGGFALITETRMINLPAGKTVIRFEGVADGIIPASAIITGLPGGSIEKNRDARLLSPLNLVDGTLGREVTVRRTDRKTGEASEEPATIIAVPTNGQGGVVMRTPKGIETWRCPGVPEKLIYDGVPAGLSSKPTLSVTTRSPHGGRVKVRLSYLASGFDWSASYVATLAPAGDQLNLFAWGTLANANAESFPNATVRIVAGRLERRSDREIVAAAALLKLRCFLQGTTTSELPVITPYQRSQEIIVTGMRVAPPPMVQVASAPPAPEVSQRVEDLGDLKLYRLREPVTVAPNAQKQVALLAQPRVAFEKIYRLAIQPWDNGRDIAATISMRIRNVAQQGLGVPLPSGTTALYRDGEGGPLLLGLGTIRDVAKGEQARIAAGISHQVIARQHVTTARGRHITLSNANPFPTPVEVAIGPAGTPDFEQVSTALERVDGVPTWRVTVPANASAELDYTFAKR